MKIRFLPFLKNPPQPWNTQNWEGEKAIKYKRIAAIFFSQSHCSGQSWGEGRGFGLEIQVLN